MKRLVLLLLALLLVCDLAADGSLGKAKGFSPHSSVKVTGASPHYSAAGKLDSPDALKRAVWRGHLSESRNRPLIPVIHQTLRIIDSCHRGSSGGIPLKIALSP